MLHQNLSNSVNINANHIESDSINIQDNNTNLFTCKTKSGSTILQVDSVNEVVNLNLGTINVNDLVVPNQVSIGVNSLQTSNALYVNKSITGTNYTTQIKGTGQLDIVNSSVSGGGLLELAIGGDGNAYISANNSSTGYYPLHINPNDDVRLAENAGAVYTSNNELDDGNGNMTVKALNLSGTIITGQSSALNITTTSNANPINISGSYTTLQSPLTIGSSSNLTASNCAAYINGNLAIGGTYNAFTALNIASNLVNGTTSQIGEFITPSLGATTGNNLQGAAASCIYPIVASHAGEFVTCYGLEMLPWKTSGMSGSIGTATSLWVCAPGCGTAQYCAQFCDGNQNVLLNIPSSISTTSGTTLGIDSGNNLIKISSSQKYKKNIVDSKIDTEKVFDLQVREFDYKSDNAHDIGLIAEEVEKILPCLVNYNNKKECESVKYDRISLLLLGEVIKLRKRIDEL